MGSARLLLCLTTLASIYVSEANSKPLKPIDADITIVFATHKTGSTFLWSVFTELALINRGCFIDKDLPAGLPQTAEVKYAAILCLTFFTFYWYLSCLRPFDPSALEVGLFSAEKYRPTKHRTPRRRRLENHIAPAEAYSTRATPMT
jgi:hypothetical protein